MSKSFVEELSTRMLKELDVLSKQKGIKVDDPAAQSLLTLSNVKPKQFFLNLSRF